MMGSGEGTSDLFQLKSRVEFPVKEAIQCLAKVAFGGHNFFAASIKNSGDLVLIGDGIPKFSGAPEIGPVDKNWTLKNVPWFEDPNKRISALAFDGDGMLYIGTLDGHIYDLNVCRVLDGSPSHENELKLVFHLHELRIIQLLIWHRENMKMVLCNGDNSKLAIVHANALPVLITFLSNISHLEIFNNTVGLSCLLVCLENQANVYCVLDDLEIPHYEPEAPGKKSLFRKARDNIMSKFTDEKMNFFNRKGNKESIITNEKKTTSVVSSTSLPASVPSMGSTALLAPKQYPISNIKFMPVEEVHCRGLLRKISGKNQFARHVNNKLDIFDVDFRQTAAVYIPNHISKLYVVQRIFFGVDEEHKCLRVSVVHSGTLKEFALIPTTSRILSIEPLDQDDPSVAPYSVFIIYQHGISEVCLKKAPIETCVDLLLKETNNLMIDVVCNALNVAKSNVCVVAGDTRAEEGKFAKAILYYKIAGLSYMKIMAKFGSRGHIPAMLCFYDLMDQEQKNKLSGNNQDRQAMANLALAGRVEQYLRHGKSLGDIARSPKNMLKNMLSNNPHYTAKHAAKLVCHVQLLWALKLLGQARLCYPHILSALHEVYDENDSFTTKKGFWEVLSSDWLALYTAPPSVFDWFRCLVLQNLGEMEITHLHSLILVVLPWRRELQPKFFVTRSPNATEIIDFTVANDAGRVLMDDYVNLFIALILETIRRKNPLQLVMPNFMFKNKSEARREHVRRDSDPGKAGNVPNPYLFSVSSYHCACLRNGKVYTWGENKFGRLGHFDELGSKLNIESPTPINICPSLRISIEAVSCGINHTLALTSVGTILTWGSNAFGQLGLGKQTMWTSRPVPLTLAPDVIVIRVAAGGYHSVAIDHLNRVWTWGWGVHGQLGDGGFENCYKPCRISVSEKIVHISAGHSHTAMLSTVGHVYTCGCSHFGQTGQGVPQKKVKVPTKITQIPSGVTFRIVEAGLCGTVMVSAKNRLYYAGLNPGTLRTLLSGQKRREQRNNALAAGVPQSEIVFEEEKDYAIPVIIDSSHVAGEIVKVSVATTHMGILTSMGMVYTWGLGKSGQLVRPDDDSRTLELIDTEDKIFIASDISCGGDCTFVIERETNRCFGCGFNSSGQLGKLQSEDESAVMTIKTKKRVVKVRQPSNIYFRLREVAGLPKPLWDNDSYSSPAVHPKSLIIDQELLEGILKSFKRHYDPKVITDLCLQYENYAAASMLETMAENHEFALKHSLSLNTGCKGQSASLIGNYLNNMDKANSASVSQACRFLKVLIDHWTEKSLRSSDLEEILEPYQCKPPWNVYLNCAVTEIISSSDDSAKWIAANMTPVFILNAIKDSKNGSTNVTLSAATETATNNGTHLLSADSENPNESCEDAPASPTSNHTSANDANDGEESLKTNGICRLNITTADTISFGEASTVANTEHEHLPVMENDITHEETNGSISSKDTNANVSTSNNLPDECEHS